LISTHLRFFVHSTFGALELPTCFEHICKFRRSCAAPLRFEHDGRVPATQVFDISCKINMSRDSLEIGEATRPASIPGWGKGARQCPHPDDILASYYGTEHRIGLSQRYQRLRTFLVYYIQDLRCVSNAGERLLHSQLTVVCIFVLVKMPRF
jgi:hypothetical protein